MKGSEQPTGGPHHEPHPLPSPRWPSPATLLLTAGAHAAPLNDAFGGAHFADTAITGTTVAARRSRTVLTDVLTPFTVGNVTGVVQNRVVRETGTGTLDFYWRIEVDPSTNADGVSALRLADFGYSSLTDADWRIDGLGTDAPSTARLFNPAGTRRATSTSCSARAARTRTQSSNFFFLHTDAT